MKLRLFIFICFTAFVFSNGACGDGVDTALSPIGGACMDATDCETDVCIEELGTGVAFDPITFEEGYCSLQGCEITDQFESIGCPEDSACLYYTGTGGAIGFCFDTTCEVDEDCREDYTCEDLGHGVESSFFCLPIDATDGAASREHEVNYKELYINAPMAAKL